jgi:hypothetical protein
MAGKKKDVTLKLASFTFDPLTRKPSAFKKLLTNKKQDSTTRVIQFIKPLAQDEKNRIKIEYGLRLTDYVPDFAYLERIQSVTLERLSKDPLFRAEIPYLPAFKVSPTIGKKSFRTDERKMMNELWLNTLLFSDTDVDQLVSILNDMGAADVKVIDDRRIVGSLQIRFKIVSRSKVDKLAEREEIRWIEEVPERIEDNVNTASTLQSGTAGNQTIWNRGLHGEQQVIGMIDSSPLDINHCFFRDALNNTPSSSHRKVLSIRNASGTAAGAHATFVAGCASGDDLNNSGTHNQRGGAWAARLVSGNNADLSTNSMLAELVAAANMDARIHTNSWHDDTAGSGNPATYNQTAADVDTFTWNNEDNLVLGSAGNVSEEQGPPGTAKNAICIGASQADPNEMNFGDGNSGPTADGRQKPDLMAPGCGIQSSTVNTACTTGPRAACATSYATPHAAAAAALVRQYYMEGYYPTGTQQPHHSFIPSGALLKATLLNSTIDMTNITGYPNNQEGWWLIRLDNVLFFPGSTLNLRVWDTRNVDGITTGQTRTHHIDIQSNVQRLKVTLVWTDPPGAASSATPAVNNLDLQVISPGGAQTFLGNMFSGGVSINGGTADTLNNVEIVLLNNPAPGDWTIQITGTAINVGNPGQGYALVVTADLTEPPVTTGVQDTLVVRAKFADISSEPSLPNLQNRMSEVANYINQVSYGQTTVNRIFRGPLTLDHIKDYYYHPDRNLLIELTEEVVSKLVSSEPTLFNNLERIIIVINDINFTEDWATTGTWPYQLPTGFTRPISVSIQSYDNSAARFTHGLLHQFNLVDLYAHEGVIFPRPYVDEWDNMGGQYNNVHPLIWSKERAGWLTSHGDTIHYIPRPSPGASYSGLNPIPIFRNTSRGVNRKAIAIGLSEGAATLGTENVFYFIEARSNASGTYDSSLPGSGVLVYYVNEMISQGEGPVILRDKNLLTQGLADAFFSMGDSITIPGTGITLNVQAGTGGADFNIQVNYTAPVTDYNLAITRGDTINGQFVPYFSPDIWIDSPKNGFNLGSGPPPHDQREQPVAGQINRIYARIHNHGPATAFDFDVRFRVSEPYHTVGQDPDFNKFVGIKHISSLGGGTESDVFVEWTPETMADPHTCVKVDLINLVGTDTNNYDNWAQENLQIATSVTSSPFHPVTYSYNLTNPYETSALFYFRAEGIPAGWTAELVPRKIRLNSQEQMTGTAIITPPKDAEICTSELIQITSWTPRGDTLINVGGGAVQVDLRRPTVIKLEGNADQCNGDDIEKLIHDAKKEGKEINVDTVRKHCGRMSVNGCTDPPIPGQEVILKYVDPLGNISYHTVKTDEDGCFEDIFVSVNDGTWQVSAEYPGGKCEAPVTEGPISVCWCHG